MPDHAKPTVQPRAGVKIDFGAAIEAAPPRAKIDEITTRAAVADAREAGFSTRADPVKIDGRSLRRTDRVAQMNIKLSPSVRDAFQSALIDYIRGDKKRTTEDFIEYLLKLHQQQGR